MARPRKIKVNHQEQPTIMDTSLKTAEDATKVPIEQMPLATLRDYRLYNEEARKLNHKLGICRYPIKQCPVELHPKQRVVFRRNDQPSNPLTVFLSNHLIHFDEKLMPGQTYDLPICVINHLAEKGNPVWKWFTSPDGSKETRISHKEPRFSLQTVYQEV